MENTTHPAYTKLSEVGREITTKVKPKAVVVFSAHWSGGPNKIKINVAENADLIYDFYGFPPHYYEHEYPNKGSREVAAKVVDRIAAAGVEVERVERGLDHGVWVGFIAGEYYRKPRGGRAVLIQCNDSVRSKEEPIERTNCTSLAI